MFLNNLLNLEESEKFLRNATFLTLFFTTIFYWIYSAFYNNSFYKKVLDTSQKDYQPAGNLDFATVSSEFLQSKTFLNSFMNSKLLKQENKTGKAGLSVLFPRSSMALSNLLLILLLLVRWKISGHFPLSNLYESLMFLAWCCTFLYLIYSTSFTNSIEKILGSIIASSALLFNAFATFSLPKEMQQSAPLVPALQSNWLMMHVTVMIISYATLIIGSLLSILFLILTKLSTTSVMRKDYYDAANKTELGCYSRKTTSQFTPQSQFLTHGVMVKDKQLLMPTDKHQLSSQGFEKKFVLTDKFTTLKLKLDSLSYRIISLGFPFLTIGILSGAVWANEAWGSYWSWDPKETWALLTWLVFAIYLHTRLTKGWQGKKPAIIASLGFMIVCFCYLGVNLIGEGLHSYGFF